MYTHIAHFLAVQVPAVPVKMPNQLIWTFLFILLIVVFAFLFIIHEYWIHKLRVARNAKVSATESPNKDGTEGLSYFSEPDVLLKNLNTGKTVGIHFLDDGEQYAVILGREYIDGESAYKRLHWCFRAQKKNIMPVPGESVSALHCKIYKQNGQIWICEISGHQSKNGTKLGKERYPVGIEPVEIKDKLLILGSEEFEVVHLK